MGGRNRKNRHEGRRAVYWGIPLVAFLAALGLAYLHMINACDNVGREIKRLENERAEIRKRVANEELNWGMASSIRNVEGLMSKHGIEMTWPEERQIIRLRAAEPDEPAQYACGVAAGRRD